ncbi:hypothetical protein TRFO_34129 [Tritrichomonas foetus]|uniref:Leucine Rich Repeat family protein n=1 Tax=Tritrichomonas foetus TaxID=1144522 RepID=A0A1J4JL59_9EUKA|nr:hypothetical protein TRFO_34129 [Tritrichomonas foetus]|eukprot:OHS99409.1 hypothetical protein TRFO_34129 [Tritrichomonas foetus]
MIWNKINFECILICYIQFIPLQLYLAIFPKMSKELKFYDEKLLEKVKPVIDISDELIITCLRVQNAATRTQLEEGVLVATESTVYLLVKIGHRYQITTKFLWPSITKISLENKFKIQIIYTGGGIILQTNDAPVIATQIFGHLVNILPANEVPSFEGDTSLITKKEPTKDAPYFRFLFLLSRSGQTPQRQFLNDVASMMKGGSVFDFASILGAQHYVECLLDSVIVAPELTTLTLPGCHTGTNWSLLSKVLSQKANKKLESITICDKIDQTFSEFADCFKTIKHSPLKRMKFCETKLTESDSKVFADFIQNSNVESVCFSKACNVEFLAKFLREITNRGVDDKLKSLTLEKLPNLRPADIFANFPNVKELSIIGCDIDVSSFLNSLPNAQKIHKLCFSNCRAVSPVNKATQLPNSLTNASFTRVQFEQATFADTWVLFMRHKPTTKNVHLTMSSSIVPDAIWEAFFKAVPRTASQNLTHLNYESNPILPQFIQFLSNLQNLQHLSLAGCFRPENTAIINQFSEYIKTNTTVKSLSLAGNEFGQMRASVSPILKDLISNTALKSLDLTNCNFGDGGYSSLGTLLSKNKRITEIQIIGNPAQSSEKLLEFFTILGGRISKLSFHYPRADLHEMKKKKLITSDQVSLIQKLYQKIMSFKLESNNDMITYETEEAQFSTRKATPSDLLTTKEWEFPFPSLPVIDNTDLVLQLRAAFTTQNLVSVFIVSP